MWLKILCYCCCKRGRGPKLSAAEKRKKWFRLVAVMSLKQYGTRLIANFFYAFLFAEALSSMRDIWKDFREYSDCNNEYTANLTRLVSEQYSQAADELATAVQETSACITSTLDLKAMGFSLPIGDLMDLMMGNVFSWFTPGQGRIPLADLDLESNTDEVMQEVADDLEFLGTVSFWVRMIGFIMTFVTIAVILLKATFYTLENQPWKPGAVGLTMRFVEAFRVIAVYVVLMSAVFLQAYLTDKSCQVNVNNTVIETPMCEVAEDNCEFICHKKQQNFTSPCTECDIKYNWWWTDWDSWPNILGAVYLAFIMIVVIVELWEAKNQKKELNEAGLREKEEKERRKQEKLENKKRKEARRLKSEKSTYEPPTEQIMDADTKIEIESGGYEDKPRTKKKSKSKSKSKTSHSEPGSSTRVEDSALLAGEIEDETSSSRVERV